MKTILLTLTFTLTSLYICAQTKFTDPYRDVTATNYSVELVIYYQDQLLSKMPWCQKSLTLANGMNGKLSLRILDDSQRLTAIESPTFQVAIKDTVTGTQRMFSNQIYQEIEVEEIIKQCQEGESMIILTTNKKYKLAQNIIELMLGC